MSKMRRVTIIEGMFKDISKPEEDQKVNDLYQKGFKSIAIVYMLRIIREKWIELINQNVHLEVVNKEDIAGFEHFGVSLFKAN